MKKVSTALFGMTLGMSMTLPMQASAGSNNNIDRVLGQLSAQHNNASSLVRSARQPSSLSASSPLLSRSSSRNVDNDAPILDRLTAVASNTVNRFKQTGIASWYGRQFHGRPTASGETFDMNAMTAAHSTLPMNCYVRVTNRDNGKSVIVKINDRPKTSRVLDLSYGAAQAIGMKGNAGNVTIERID